MNTQMDRPRTHSAYDQDDPLHTLGSQPGEIHEESHEHDHGERKSVLKKVKATAKKIKDSVTGHHGNHDHDDNDDDVEMETDPQAHGVPTGQREAPKLDEVARLQGSNAGERSSIQVVPQLPTSEPVYFQTFEPISTEYVPGQEETLGHVRTDTETRLMPTSKLGGDYQTFDPSRTRYVPGQEETLGRSKTDTGRPFESEERPYAPRNTPVGNVGTRSGVSHGSAGFGVGQRGILQEIGGILDRPLPLEEDPHAPKDRGIGNFRDYYQAKVADPTGRGAKEMGVTPILHQLDKMGIHDESGGQRTQKQNPKPTTQQESLFKPSIGHETAPSTNQKQFTGSHDQFSPEPLTPETSTLLANPEPEPEPQFCDTTEPPGPESYDQKSEDQKQGRYTEKMSSAATMVADKAKQATNIVTSKLTEYSGTTQEGSIGNKVATAVGPVFEKVAEMGSTVASMVQSGPRTELELEPVQMPADKGVSVKEYLAEKLMPSEEDRVLSEIITGTLPLRKQRIKDAAASLFGKGGEEKTQTSSDGSNNDNSASGY